MPLQIIRDDITRLEVDAIVNAANTSLAMGGGVCGAIFNAAGIEQMQQACAGLGPIATGEAVITPGFGLPARHVIHVAGPVYSRQNPQQSGQLLRTAYRNALQLAVDNGCRSIAFPLISSGIYGYPKDQALSVARDSIREFLERQEVELDVRLVVFDKDAYQLSRELLGEVASFIRQHYVDQLDELYARGRLHYQVDEQVAKNAGYPATLLKPDDAAFNLQLDEPFEVYLLQLIRDSGKSEVQVYKGANLTRQLFSKIRTGNGYVPGKRTILALAISLELDLEQTERLLNHAGYALTRSQLFDVIVECYIRKGLYDIFQINEMLFEYDQPLFG